MVVVGTWKYHSTHKTCASVNGSSAIGGHDVPQYRDGLLPPRPHPVSEMGGVFACERKTVSLPTVAAIIAAGGGERLSRMCSLSPTCGPRIGALEGAAADDDDVSSLGGGVFAYRQRGGRGFHTPAYLGFGK